jgi:hypothetical protein
LRRQKHRRPRRPVVNLSKLQLRPRQRPRPRTELPPPAPQPEFKPDPIMDMIQRARQMVEQQQRVVYSRSQQYNAWNQWIFNNMPGGPSRPTEPGPEAEEWLQDQVKALGQDKVFDYWENEYRTQLEAHHALTSLKVIYISHEAWTEQIAIKKKKIKFARWVIQHSLMDSIAC